MLIVGIGILDIGFESDLAGITGSAAGVAKAYKPATNNAILARSTGGMLKHSETNCKQLLSKPEKKLFAANPGSTQDSLHSLMTSEHPGNALSVPEPPKDRDPRIVRRTYSNCSAPILANPPRVEDGSFVNARTLRQAESGPCKNRPSPACAAAATDFQNVMRFIKQPAIEQIKIGQVMRVLRLPAKGFDQRSDFLTLTSHSHLY